MQKQALSNMVVSVRNMETAPLLNKRQLLRQAKLIPVRFSIKIAVLTDATVKELTDFLSIILRFHGVSCTFWIGDFNKIYEDAVFRTKEISQFGPDLVLIHETGRAFSPDHAYDDFIQEHKTVWDKLSGLKCTVVQTTIPLPSEAVFQKNIVRQIYRYNSWIHDCADSISFLRVFDLQSVAASIGLDHWYDNKLWYLFGCAYSQKAVPTVAKLLAKMVLALTGRSHKLIVLDLDNTLWGGVFVEDGISCVELGGETAKGKAYRDFQMYIYRLKQRGMLLAICSKNTKALISDCFSHRNSILHWEDFVTVRINWNNKPDNIQQIAAELKIGLDSIIFVDDSSVERAYVRSALPQVCVPEMTDVDSYIQTIERELIFEENCTAEDFQRTKYYQDNDAREAIRVSSVSREAYLRGLEMRLLVVPPENHITRITQLINKTNQFQITGQRTSEAAILAYLESSILIPVRLVDKLGDNGIISIIGASFSQEAANIDYWVMSCRVFQRDVEYALFSYFVELCKQRSIQYIKVHYQKTDKNAMAQQFLERVGFVPKDSPGDYLLCVSEFKTTHIDYLEVYDDKRNDS